MIDYEPHYESEAKCKVFVMKISFHSYENKTNFHMKSFALSLAFIVRFTATSKWPIRLPFVGCQCHWFGENTTNVCEMLLIHWHQLAVLLRRVSVWLR